MPETVRVIGLNFGEHSEGIYCMWILGGEEQEPVAGEFDATGQLLGDDEQKLPWAKELLQDEAEEKTNPERREVKTRRRHFF